MSAEVDALPSNGDVDDSLTPEGLNGGGSEDDADLFGDDDDDDVQREAHELNRKLDDSELDSGDDQGRTDRIEPTIEDDHEIDDEEKQVRMLQVDLARIKPPEGDDLYFLNMPPFLGVKHKAFQPSTYEPPTTPHEARDQTKSENAGVISSSKFSAFSTASTTMFWRRDPKNPSLVQSNSRLVRWSDGSITLQIASQPKDHYRVSTNPLRQGWPKKQGAGAGSTIQDYDPNRDTHNYLAAPHAVVGVDLQIVSPFDAALKIQPTGDYVDESVLKLQQSLAAATEQHDPIATLRATRVDPELAKREAERFEKDRVKANRKVEAAQERLITRRDRVIGRAGMGGRMGGAGLSIAGLEDEDGMPGARGSTKAKAAKRRKTNRRGEIYSDDEDEDTHRGRREDEYDREDDFLAASDEEPEIYDDDGGEDEVEAEEDDPDVDDLEIEGRETVVNSRTRGEQGRRGGRERGSTPKRAASGDDDGTLPQGSPQRGKRRRFIDDDDDEDEGDE